MPAVRLATAPNKARAVLASALMSLVNSWRPISTFAARHNEAKLGKKSQRKDKIRTLTLFLRRRQPRERNLVLRLAVRDIDQSRIRGLPVVADRRPERDVHAVEAPPLELDDVACVDQPMSRVTRAAKIDSCTGTHLQRSIST